jgi:hypothetical protein
MEGIGGIQQFSKLEKGSVEATKRVQYLWKLKEASLVVHQLWKLGNAQLHFGATIWLSYK